MPILTAEWIFPISSKPINNGYVQFEGASKCPSAHRIQSVGRLDDLDVGNQCPSDVLPPKPGSLITPGLINTHVHLEQSWPELVRRGETETFLDWLLRVVALNHASSDSLSKRARCDAGVQELLQTGTTCVNDIASGSESMKALEHAGLRGIVSLECFYPGVPSSDAFSLARLAMIRDAYHAFCADHVSDNDRLRCALSPHSPYNVSVEAWQWLLEELNPSVIHSHVAEWLPAESQYLACRGGDVTRLHQSILGKSFSPSVAAHSPVSALQQANLLRNNVILAHCIETSSADRLALRQSGVRVAHCPRSNVHLHEQSLHWNDWKESGISMGLGTDGRLSTPDLDLRAEARFAQGHHGWDAEQALDMMTRQGAQVMNLPNHTGTLEIGSFADLVVWQSESNNDFTSSEARVLVESTSVQEVFIDGLCRWQANIPAGCR